MTISSGNYTVATTGADYATWNAAFSDLEATLTGNLKFTQIGDIAETGDVNVSVALDGYTLEIDNDSPHGGVVGVGHITTMDGAGVICQVRIDPTGDGSCIIHDIQCKQLSDAYDSKAFFCVSNGMTAVGGTLEFYNMLLDNNGRTKLLYNYVRTPTAALSPSANYYNNIQTGFAGNNDSTYSLYIQCSSRPGVEIANCTVDRSLATGASDGPCIRIEGTSSSTTKVKNCVAFKPSGSDPAFDHTGSGSFAADMINCASSDASAVGGTPVINFVAATEFESLVSTDAEYLTPKASSQFKEAGTSVNHTEDIAGNAYGANPPMGAHVAVSVTDFTWTGDGADENASTDLNWHGGTAPGASDAVVFDATSVKNCTWDIPEVLSITVNTGYTGTISPSVDVDFNAFTLADGVFNGGANNLQVNAFTLTGGVFNAPSLVLTVLGDWLRTAGTFAHMDGRVDFNLTTGAQTVDNHDIVVFYKLGVAKGVFDLDVVTTKVQVSKRFIIDNDAASSSPELSGTVEMVDDSKVEQNGNLYGTGAVRFNDGSHEWIQNNTDTSAQMPQIDVDCVQLTLTEGTPGNRFGMPTFTWAAGVIVNAETAHFTNNRQFQHVEYNLYQPLTIGELTLNLSNFDLTIRDELGTGPSTLQVAGDFNMLNLGSGSQYTGAGSTLAVGGNYIQGGPSAAVSTSTLRLLFNGAGDQHISIPDAGVSNIPTDLLEIDKPSGTLTLLDTDIDQNVAGSSFLHMSGTLDLNGYNLSVTDDITICDDCADLAGSTLTAGGEIVCKNAIMSGSDYWFTVSAGAVTFTTCYVCRCDNSASEGAFAVASFGCDSDNINVTFVGRMLFWIGASAGLASDDTRWSTTPGGPNDATAPSINDAAIYTADGLGDCEFDISQIVEVGILDGYTSTITPSVEVYLTADLVNRDTTTGRWDNTTFDLIVDGDILANVGGNGGILGNSGTVWYVGGNVAYDYGIVLANNARHVFQHSRDNPTHPKLHTISHNANNSDWANTTVADNQVIQPKSNWITSQVIWGSGCTLLPDTVSRQIQINGNVWQGVTGLSIPSVNAAFGFFVRASDCAGGDYGASNFEFANPTQDLTGVIVTTGDVLFRRSSGGTSAAVLKGGAAIHCHHFGVGNTFTGARGFTFTQEAGSNVTASGDATVYADDTIQTTSWVRAVGSSASITGLLLVETEAHLDWSAVTTDTEVGAFSFSGTSHIDYSGAELLITGDGSVNSGNSSNTNRDINVRLVDGGVISASGNLYMDDFGGPSSGNGSVIGSGQILLRRYTNGQNVTVQGTSDGGLMFSYANTPIKAVDYGNASVTGPDGCEITGDTNDFAAYRLEVSRTTIPSTTNVFVNGTINVTVFDLQITDNVSNQRGGIFHWNSSGSLHVTGPINVRAPSGVDSELEVADGAGLIIADGDLNVGAGASLTFLGDGELRVAGEVAIDPTAVVNWGTSTLELTGASNQNVTLATNPHNLIESKVGTPTVTYNDDWVATGVHTINVRSESTRLFLAGGVYGADHLDIVRTGALTNVQRAVIDSSDGSTQFDYTVSGAGVTARNMDFSNMNFLGADQPCDSVSCGDISNNNTSPPSPGLLFAPAPPLEPSGIGGGIVIGDDTVSGFYKADRAITP